MAVIGVLQQQSGPDTCLMTCAVRAGRTSTRRRFFLTAKRARASGVKLGAAMASTKSLLFLRPRLHPLRD